MRIMLVAGARPNFMKIAPVLSALEDRGAEAILVHTGQHYDPLMSDVFLDELGIRKPDHHLEAGSGTHAEQTAAIMVAFEPLVDRLHPDVIAVPGDVNGTMACALVGAKAGSLVAHIEAGLRSRDWAMPEEINRVVAHRVADQRPARNERRRDPVPWARPKNATSATYANHPPSPSSPSSSRWVPTSAPPTPT